MNADQERTMTHPRTAAEAIEMAAQAAESWALVCDGSGFTTAEFGAAQLVAARIAMAIRALAISLPAPEDVREGGCLCQGCGRRYRVDLLVPDELWEKVRPDDKDGAAGLLCGPCIMIALELRGEFGSYSLAALSQPSPALVEALRRCRAWFRDHSDDGMDDPDWRPMYVVEAREMVAMIDKALGDGGAR